MALSHKAKRRWSLVILLVGLPIYIIFAIAGVALANEWLGRPGIWLEFLIFAVLGIVWALPFKYVFLGVGQADPEARDPRD